MTTVEEMTRDQLKAHIQEHSLDVPTNIGTEEMRYNVIKLRDAQGVVATVTPEQTAAATAEAKTDEKADAPAQDAAGAPLSEFAAGRTEDEPPADSVAPSASDTPTQPPPPPAPPVPAASAPTTKHEKPKQAKASKAPKAPETKADDKAADEAPAAVYYRVERYSKWVSDGVVHQLRADSFVNSLSHPIDELRSQGVPLVEVSAPDDDPGVGHRFA